MLDHEPIYGMGDCRTFADMPPLVHWEDGSTCINPDFEHNWRFHRSALAKDPSGPLPEGLVPVVTIPAGATVDWQLKVDREENGMGHFLINELFMLTDPTNANNIEILIKDQQSDRTYMSFGVFRPLLFSTTFLSACLTCPIMLFPNQALIIRTTNREVFPVTMRVEARGKRFMPYHDWKLVQEMENCWSHMVSNPFWLTLDDTQITIPAGGRVRSQMSVPGGWFFYNQPRVMVTVGGALVVGDDIFVEVTDGRIGKRLMDGPISLGSHYATPTLTVPGFPGNTFSAASAVHCPPQSMFFRPSTRLIHDFFNDGPAEAIVRLTYEGCLTFADKCPPHLDVERERRIDLMFAHNPLYVDMVQEEGCQTAEEAPQPRVIAMWRRLNGNSLPAHLAFVRYEDQRTEIVVRDPRTNAVVRPAAPHETPSWAGRALRAPGQQAGMEGLGARPSQGEWEAL